MTVAVLIVNWNGGELLTRCLESVHAQQRRPDRIIVVDNASTDDSLSRASDALRGVELIRLPSNVGFAKANNLAARAAGGCDALALLNPDAVAQPEWLHTLMNEMERNPAAAGFASRMLLASTPQYLDGAGDSYHVSGRAWRNGHGQPLQQWPGTDGEVFGPCAAAALYRREAFDEVGGFDEQYFCYFEDVDLAFRMRLRGHRFFYVHAAIVHHVGSALSGYRSDFAVYHGERNAVWTFVKDMPAPLFWLYLPQHVALNCAALLYYPWRGQGRVVLRAKVDALRGLRIVLARRKLVQRARQADAWVVRAAMARGVLAPYRARYTAPVT